MQFYDYILTGGGIASLSLALQMAGSSLRDKRILILSDGMEAQQNASQLLWLKQASPFDEILTSWPRARYVSHGLERELAPGAYRFALIREKDFRNFADQRLCQMPAVERASGRIERIYDAAGQARVRTGTAEYSANWVFDASSGPDPLAHENDRFLHLKKQTKEWEIEVAQDCFNADLPTLLDFRIPQEGQARFMQVFPFSARRALVKFVAFTPEILRGDEISAALQGYLRETLQILRFDVLIEEDQVISLTDRPFVRRDGFRILRIGQPGGMVKPSNGLSFQRIQRDSADICASLVEKFHPFSLPRTAARYRLFDAAMLQCFAGQGQGIETIVDNLLKRNSVEHILRFLNEDTARQEDLPLLAGLPWTALLQAAMHGDIFRKK